MKFSTDQNETEKNSAKITATLQDLYGYDQSYIALQGDLFSRKQQKGETLQEFALMCLMHKVTRNAPDGMTNADVLLWDQFIEYVNDDALCRELKQLVHSHPTVTLIEAGSEAIRWEWEGMPGDVRGRSHSISTVSGLQYGVQGSSQASINSTTQELAELKDMLRKQQEQITQLT